MDSFYKAGTDRSQHLLFPPSLDEFIDEANSVRAIDDYVSILDLKKLGFKDTRQSPRSDGQKAYSPQLLLKIYIYGYLNKIRSSRMLERECKRNVEMMWLTQNLVPSYHTIADFRKDNPKALKAVFREFVLLCKKLELIGDGIKAVDGAFFKANASKNQLLMKNNLEKDLIKVDEKIDQYLATLDATDNERQPIDIGKEIPKDLKKLKAKQEKINAGLELLNRLNKKQHNYTDPDASLMKKPGHNLMAYNTQIVVDDKQKLIIATDISSKGNDNEQLHKMSRQAKATLESSSMNVVADTGYYSAKEIKKCRDEDIDVIVPEANRTRQKLSQGKFSRDHYKYDQESDCYTCPNEVIIKRTNSKQVKNGKTYFKYVSPSAICKTCPLKDQCLSKKSSYKQLYRWEHEAVIDAHKLKMETANAKELIKKRGSIVEHPFGTIKRALGWDHFLVRGKEKVSGENALIMFAYNFRRVLNILGNNGFRAMIRAT